jgi:hypothetical protein
MSTNSNPPISPIAQIRALHGRLVKAESLVTENKVHPVINMPDHYIVEGNAGFYIVNGSCCCNDAINRNELIKGHCKHRLAAMVYAEQHAKLTPTNETESPECDEELEHKVAELYH